MTGGLLIVVIRLGVPRDYWIVFSKGRILSSTVKVASV